LHAHSCRIKDTYLSSYMITRYMDNGKGLTAMTKKTEVCMLAWVMMRPILVGEERGRSLQLWEAYKKKSRDIESIMKVSWNLKRRYYKYRIWYRRNSTKIQEQGNKLVPLKWKFLGLIIRGMIMEDMYNLVVLVGINTIIPQGTRP